MKYSKLIDEEIITVTNVINEILKSDDFSQMLNTHSLIKIVDRRDDIYLIEASDSLHLSNLMTGKSRQNFKILAFKTKLGFFIRQEFRIGIESLRFIASLCSNPVILSSRQEQKFIYGKDIRIRLDEAKKVQENYLDGSLILISNNKGMPIGYAKVFPKEDFLQLKNIVDIGIYLRSEKTAF